MSVDFTRFTIYHIYTQPLNSKFRDILIECEVSDWRIIIFFFTYVHKLGTQIIETVIHKTVSTDCLFKKENAHKNKLISTKTNINKFVWSDKEKSSKLIYWYGFICSYILN